MNEFVSVWAGEERVSDGWVPAAGEGEDDNGGKVCYAWSVVQARRKILGIVRGAGMKQTTDVGQGEAIWRWNVLEKLSFMCVSLFPLPS